MPWKPKGRVVELLTSPWPEYSHKIFEHPTQYLPESIPENSLTRNKAALLIEYMARSTVVRTIALYIVPRLTGDTENPTFKGHSLSQASQRARGLRGMLTSGGAALRCPKKTKVKRVPLQAQAALRRLSDMQILYVSHPFPSFMAFIQPLP
jgi:hypothetical protein